MVRCRVVCGRDSVSVLTSCLPFDDGEERDRHMLRSMYMRRSELMKWRWGWTHSKSVFFHQIPLILLLRRTKPWKRVRGFLHETIRVMASQHCERMRLDVGQSKAPALIRRSARCVKETGRFERQAPLCLGPRRPRRSTRICVGVCIRNFESSKV
jgi:hypothetical protein